MKFVLCIVFATSHLYLCAQDGVGIGTTDVDNSAVLQINSITRDKGVLFPKSAPSLLYGVRGSSANGLFMYDSVASRFSYFKSDRWMYVNPWDTEEIQNASNVNYISTPYAVGIGTATAPTEALEVNGTVKATDLDAFGIVPVGGIIMWSGSEASIPSNFQLCNGGTKNGITTPDLIGRFIVAGNSGAAGGGTNTSSTTQIIYREESQYTISEPTCSQNQYIYSGEFTVEEQGICDPSILGTWYPFSNEPGNECRLAAAAFMYRSDYGNGTYGPDCVFGEVRNCTQVANPNYYLTKPSCRVSGVNALNVVTSSENRPAYYQLAYIMRVQ